MQIFRLLLFVCLGIMASSVLTSSLIPILKHKQFQQFIREEGPKSHYSKEGTPTMKKFKPDVVIGTGGFVCFPVIYAGHKYGARCFLHEQNAFPGVANRSLERYAEKVFLGFAEAGHYFKEPEKHVVVGNPVRKRFFEITREEARKTLGIADSEFVIFSFGGSQGAEGINNVAFELMRKVSGMTASLISRHS